MSSPRMLTGNVFDLSRSPQANDTVTITPVFPSDISGVSGIGILDDGVMLPDAVTVATNSAGEFTAMVIPTSQSRAGASMVGISYIATFGAGETLAFQMPDANTTLNTALGSTVSPEVVGALTDAGILNIIQPTRTTADRGKHLAVSATNQDELALVTPPTGGGGGVPLTDDAVLDLAKPTRIAADRGKALATSTSDENNLVLAAIEQSDWDESSSSSSAFIKNKPNVELKIDGEVSVNYNANTLINIPVAWNNKYVFVSKTQAVDVTLRAFHNGNVVIPDGFRCVIIKSQPEFNGTIQVQGTTLYASSSAVLVWREGSNWEVVKLYDQQQADWDATGNSAEVILNKPTIPAAQVPSDWGASSGVSRILNKPTIPTLDDDSVLDLAQATRTNADRGKVLSVSTSSENKLVLTTPASGGGNPRGAGTGLELDGNNLGLDMVETLPSAPTLGQVVFLEGTVANRQRGFYKAVDSNEATITAATASGLTGYDSILGVGSIDPSHTRILRAERTSVQKLKVTFGGTVAVPSTLRVRINGTGSYLAGTVSDKEFTSTANIASWSAGTAYRLEFFTDAGTTPYAVAEAWEYLGFTPVSSDIFSATDILNQTVDFTANNIWVDTGVAWPANSTIKDDDLYTVSTGRASDRPFSGSYLIRGSDIKNLVATPASGSIPLGTTIRIDLAVQFRTFANSNTVTEGVISLGKATTSNNILVAATSESSFDSMPLKIQKLNFVGTGGGGGSVNLTDDSVLDLAQQIRTSADRGKVLGVSSTDENELALLSLADGSITATQTTIYDGEFTYDISTNQGQNWQSSSQNLNIKTGSTRYTWDEFDALILYFTEDNTTIGDPARTRATPYFIWRTSFTATGDFVGTFVRGVKGIRRTGASTFTLNTSYDAHWNTVELTKIIGVNFSVSAAEGQPNEVVFGGYGTTSNAPLLLWGYFANLTAAETAAGGITASWNGTSFDTSGNLTLNGWVHSRDDLGTRPANTQLFSALANAFSNGTTWTIDPWDVRLSDSSFDIIYTEDEVPSDSSLTVATQTANAKWFRRREPSGLWGPWVRLSSFPSTQWITLLEHSGDFAGSDVEINFSSVVNLDNFAELLFGWEWRDSNGNQIGYSEARLTADKLKTVTFTNRAAFTSGTSLGLRWDNGDYGTEAWIARVSRSEAAGSESYVQTASYINLFQAQTGGQSRRVQGIRFVSVYATNRPASLTVRAR